MSERKQLFEREAKQLEEAADLADLIACTSSDRKLRALLFAAEKNLRAASDIQAAQAEQCN